MGYLAGRACALPLGFYLRPHAPGDNGLPTAEANKPAQRSRTSALMGLNGLALASPTHSKATISLVTGITPA